MLYCPRQGGQIFLPPELAPSTRRTGAGVPAPTSAWPQMSFSLVPWLAWQLCALPRRSTFAQLCPLTMAASAQLLRTYHASRSLAMCCTKASALYCAATCSHGLSSVRSAPPCARTLRTAIAR